MKGVHSQELADLRARVAKLEGKMSILEALLRVRSPAAAAKEISDDAEGTKFNRWNLED